LYFLYHGDVDFITITSDLFTKFRAATLILECSFMDQIIRWGILGTGMIARQFATALSEIPDARLHAIASRDLAKAEHFRGEFSAAKFYGNYQALAEDEELDVIYIATPHPMHADNIKLCLNAGKPVLCEKPFTMNAREANEVIALAREKKLFLMEAMWTRFLPGIVEAQRLLQSGAIGRVQHVQADFGFYSDVGPAHRLRNLALGGGALLDLGIYPLSIAALFLGPISAANASAEIGVTGVDEQTAFTLTHTGGGLSSCFCSTRASTPIELIISGELGSMRVKHPFFNAEKISIVLADGVEKNLLAPLVGSGYAYEAMEVGRCLRSGLLESPVMSLDETLALLGWMDSIRAQIGLRYPSD
jgi:predicted dehydrogenase